MQKRLLADVHWVENRLLVIKVWNIELTLVPSLQIKLKNYSENMCDIVSEKAECFCETVDRTSVYAEAAAWRVCYKSCYEKLYRIYKKKSVPESLFWGFLVSFAKFVRTFSEQHGRLLLIIAVSIITQGVLANVTINYVQKLKHMY